MGLSYQLNILRLFWWKFPMHQALSFQTRNCSSCFQQLSVNGQSGARSSSRSLRYAHEQNVSLVSSPIIWAARMENRNRGKGEAGGKAGGKGRKREEKGSGLEL